MAQEENMNYVLREVCGRTSRLGKSRYVQEHRPTISVTGALSRWPRSCINSYSGNKEYPTNLVITRRPQH
jgi:hypothetical protein